MTDPTPKRAVHITWEDAESYGGPEWVDPTEAAAFARHKPPIMETVGFLIYSCPGWVSVTATLGSGETGSVDRIPRNMIVKITELEPRDE